MTTTTQDRRAWRGRTWLLAAPLLACVPQAAHAEKLLPGFFTGGASVLYADASTGVLSLQLTHFAHTNCPCAGTNGHALVSRVGPLAIPGIATTSETAARTVATRTTTTADAEEKSRLAGFSLLGGLIHADAIRAAAQVHVTGTAMNTSTTGSNFENLVVAGQAVPARPPQNTVIPLPGVGSVTLNAVTNVGDGVNVAGTNIVMLTVNVAETNSFGLPVGATVQVGAAHVKYNRQQPHRIVEGYANVVNTNAQAITSLPGLGPLAPVVINNCAGVPGTQTNMAAALNVGPVSLGAGSTTAQGGPTGSDSSAAQTTATVAGVSLLGLIGADAITSVATETVNGTTVTASSAGTQFGGLTVAGVNLPVDVPANTQLPLPLLGYVVVNEQIPPKGKRGPMTVNGLHVYVTTPNLMNLPVGVEIVVAHATATAEPLRE